MASEKDLTEFSAKVPTEEYDIFKRNFPQYGAVSWFINTALAAFNRKCEENPELPIIVDLSVTQMLDDARTLKLTANS